MNTNLFFFKQINSIGGIESFFYNLAQKYGKDYDITVMYYSADIDQLKRLSKYVRLKRWDMKTPVKCKRCFVTFHASYLDLIEADEYIQVLHGDYKSLGVVPQSHPKITKWVSVSEVVREAYKDAVGEDSTVCYNPLVMPKVKKALRLVSATRLTKDKGWNRMLQLAQALDNAGVPYIWDIYTDTEMRVNNKNITLHKPRLDVINYIAAADYFVQLSDSEGYCYSIVESLCVGTPVIVTDFPVAHEIGVQNGKNGWILPMSMENLPIDDICKGVKKFKYTPLEDKWGELLLPVPPDYEEEMKQIVKVRAKRIFIDLARDNHYAEYGEEWECSMLRAEELFDLGLVEIMDE